MVLIQLLNCTKKCCNMQTIDSVRAQHILISLDRVHENANAFRVHFLNELQRVMAHGLLHLLGYNDKTEKEEEM